MSKLLRTLILSQAVEDFIDSEDLKEEDLWSAEQYLVAFPQLFERLLKEENPKLWLKRIKAAREEVVLHAKHRRELR